MILSIDIGGTKIAAGLFNEQGDLLEKQHIESVIHTDLNNLARHVFTHFECLAKQVSLIGVACTGQVERDKVGFLSAGKSLPLQQQLSELFEKPVVILNDASAAALAEYEHHKQFRRMPSDSLVYITVSTGVGGGIVQNGHLIHSDNGFAAHVGHTSVNTFRHNQYLCHCGRINCAEAVSSGTALAHRASELLGDNIDARALFTDFKNHLVGQEIIEEAAQAIADLIANLKAITGTDVFVLGGSVGTAFVFAEHVKLAARTLPPMFQAEVLSPHYHKDADLYGAFLYAKRYQQEQVKCV